MNIISLDHNSSTPLHEDVLNAMLPWLGQHGANASSLHSAGRQARTAIEIARRQVAELINSNPNSVIFTSGGTEANNLILKGFSSNAASKTIIGTEIEHASILSPLKQLQTAGANIKLLPVNNSGRVDLNIAEQMFNQYQPELVSVMLANNETGVIQPVTEIADLLKESDCLVHCDATQAAGKIAVDMEQMGIDALTFSAHKMLGPQGAGALVLKQPGVLNPQQSGGEQEQRIRAGTENIAAIVGFGKAAELARLEINQRSHHLLTLRDRFEQKLTQIGAAVVFANDSRRLPNTCFFALPYYHGETLLMELDKAGFALASGSACHSQVTEPSHVLRAMGVDDDLALNAVRVSFGVSNTFEDVDRLIAKLRDLISRLPAVMRQAV